MKYIKVRYWKATGNHTKENPSNISHFDVPEELFNDQELMAESVLNWADGQPGNEYGFKFGWEKV